MNVKTVKTLRQDVFKHLSLEIKIYIVLKGKIVALFGITNGCKSQQAKELNDMHLKEI